MSAFTEIWQPAYVALTAIAGGAAWVGRIGARVKANEKALDEIKPKLEQLAETTAHVDERTKLILEELRRK